MRARRSLLVAGTLLATAACAAAAANTPVCRRGGVEWIVGGASGDAGTCDAPTARASTTPTTAPNGPVPGAAAAAPRWRDSDGAAERRQILEQELRQEQATLAAAQRHGAAADVALLGRTRANIAALQSELARLPAAR
ncbi:MAG: hypothetical protein ACOZJX_14160 [Pseudomonadota bacterium]